MKFEMLALMFIRAHRIRDFALYVYALDALAPWFFSLDRTNYSRWIPIHICDMKSLPASIKEDFSKFWVLPKTTNRFSCMPLDQGHEQNNEIVKGSGGAVGLTENPDAFRRWMVAGPEQARLLLDFEAQNLEKETSVGKNQHHEQSLSCQKTFKTQVTSLSDTIAKMGNPFLDEYPELLVLDSRNCANEDVVNTVNTIEELGFVQYQKYVKDVILERSVSIHESIKKNNLPLFKTRTKFIPNSKQQTANLKSDCNLFGQLYIASMFRGGNFFHMKIIHGLQLCLTMEDSIFQTKKSDLLNQLIIRDPVQAPLFYNAKIFDGAAIVHALPTQQVSTFGEYADYVFIRWIEQQLQNCNRVDIVWDKRTVSRNLPGKKEVKESDGR